ncbi:MAG: hypothetical protein M2R45_00690 [Verrucomicrobia subdivision 3 bacterium]|nr:hypothetical protein [Limisphaerales bacterium]MCS1414426.1 hypothetical protein [Limisphaerales bacterium]
MQGRRAVDYNIREKLKKPHLFAPSAEGINPRRRLRAVVFSEQPGKRVSLMLWSERGLLEGRGAASTKVELFCIFCGRFRSGDFWGGLEGCNLPWI